jgi:hypothetical protein
LLAGELLAGELLAGEQPAGVPPATRLERYPGQERGYGEHSADRLDSPGWELWSESDPDSAWPDEEWDSSGAGQFGGELEVDGYTFYEAGVEEEPDYWLYGEESAEYARQPEWE